MRKQIFTGKRERAEKLHRVLDGFLPGRFFLVRTHEIIAGSALYAVDQVEMLNSDGSLEELSLSFTVSFIYDDKTLAIYSFDSLWSYGTFLDAFQNVVSLGSDPAKARNGDVIGYVGCRVARDAGQGMALWKGALFTLRASPQEFIEVMADPEMRLN